eukprot:TRINITY_DN44632_c0_g1_i1.p1 TRINITY_DN44632_c0_g1~~TRINITY_DN44632_c0_g1_i1.p1  ORF type:complete len:117 (-),score=28.30 TRINITY_DN44632_c0_g1_i1:44-394(-)
MLRSLVGSEMCIRDRDHSSNSYDYLITHHSVYKPDSLEIAYIGSVVTQLTRTTQVGTTPQTVSQGVVVPNEKDMCTCLLYTSDAADEEDSVDLGGRRIIKKKNMYKIKICYLCKYR